MISKQFQKRISKFLIEGYYQANFKCATFSVQKLCSQTPPEWGRDLVAYGNEKLANLTFYSGRNLSRGNQFASSPKKYVDGVKTLSPGKNMARSLTSLFSELFSPPGDEVGRLATWYQEVFYPQYRLFPMIQWYTFAWYHWFTDQTLRKPKF